MRRCCKKVLLPLLCVVALAASAFGMLAVSGTGSTTVASKYDANNDGMVSIKEVIAYDGYIEGCWYPWFSHDYFGSSLTQNPDLERIDNFRYGDTTSTDYYQTFTKVGIDEVGEAQIKREIFNLKALGFNVMAYMGTPNGEGTIHNAMTWEVTGVRDEYLRNIRRLLDICREVGMPVLWYMLCHSSVLPQYISLDSWYRVTQFYTKDYAQSYADNFIRPVCQVLNEYRDVVVMVGLTDELENEVTDSALGESMEEGDRESYGVNRDTAVNLHRCIGQAVKQEMPGIHTVYANNRIDFAMYADSEADFVGRNQYHTGTNAHKLAPGYPTGPLIATEYGIGDGAKSSYGMDEDKWASLLTGKRDDFIAKGYTVWFHWAYQPTMKSSEAGGNQYLKQGATSTYDFRKGIYEGYYWAENRRATLSSQGKATGNHTTGNPSAMYFDGKSYNGKIYWIQPKGVTTYTVEKTVNGGATWAAVSGTVAIDSTTGSYRYCMTDPSPSRSGTVQYRITVGGKTTYTNVWSY